MSARGETSPLLQGHKHSHGDHGHSHNQNNNTNHQYMSINVFDPQDTKGVSYSVMRPECSHNHSSILEPQFSTYQKDCEASLNITELERFLHAQKADGDEKNSEVSKVVTASLWVNVFLFILKCYAYWLSGSLSIAASVIDSFLDLAVQLVIYLAHRAKMEPKDDTFPVGKSRFEQIGLLVCATIMLLGAIQLIGQSLMQLWDHEVATEIDRSSITVIAVVIIVKTILWAYCKAKQDISETISALAMDHSNDILTNLVALIAIVLVAFSQSLWWFDPIGCIAISVYICVNWYELLMEKVHQLGGRGAEPEFVDRLRENVQAYHPDVMELDQIRVYHWGERYLVEIDIVLPESMSVKESHDIAVSLQNSVEQLEQVERVFVHVDYLKRDIDEHDIHAIAALKLENLKSGNNTPTSTPVPPV